MPRLGADPRPVWIAWPVMLALPVCFACSEPPQEGSRHEPMREAPGAPTQLEPPPAPEPGAVAPTPPAAAPAPAPPPAEEAAPPVEAREPPDPAIERTLDLLAGSGRMFIDQASEPDERPSEYTAEQFASMLRTKWEWLGYDILEHEPWLDEIATRSWKTNLPYLVVLEDGTSSELRPWLDALIERPEGS